MNSERTTRAPALAPVHAPERSESSGSRRRRTTTTQRGGGSGEERMVTVRWSSARAMARLGARSPLSTLGLPLPRAWPQGQAMRARAPLLWAGPGRVALPEYMYTPCSFIVVDSAWSVIHTCTFYVCICTIYAPGHEKRIAFGDGCWSQARPAFRG